MQAVPPRRAAVQRALRAALWPGVFALALGGCMSPGPAAPLRLLQLPLAAPQEAAPIRSAAAPVWALARDVALPASLDRDAVVVASSDTALRTLPATRWAEPLRDAVPRVLRHDLGLLRADDRVWLASAPVAGARVLRVEVQQLQWRSDLGAVQLHARWWWGDAVRGDASGGVGQTGQASLQVAAEGGGTDEAQALVRAHRQALWLLAQRIAASAP